MATVNVLIFIRNGGESNASILHEVPSQEGNERCEGDNHEEWQACNSRDMSFLWYKDVQNWKGITLILISGFNKGWIFR